MPWVPIVDGHADTLSRLDSECRSLGEASTRGQSDLGRLLRAGVSLQILAICVESAMDAEAGLRRLLALIDRFYLDLAGHAEARLVGAKADLDWLGPERVGFMLAIEGADPLGKRPELLRILHRLGVRMLGLVWNWRNEFAAGAMAPDGGGLTGVGRELIAIAEATGIVVDLAHINRQGFWDVLETATKPIVVSHANARAVCEHPRNLDDDQLRALAAAGGVVGVNLYPPFLTNASRATVDDILRHLDHLLRVAGPESVGFGLDFDGIETTPVDLPDIAALSVLLRAIDRLGLPPPVRKGLLGGNWLRILRQILP